MRLAGSYIAPQVYFRVMAFFRKTRAPAGPIDLVDLMRRFRRSGYERLLVTADMLQDMARGGELLADRLCIFVSSVELDELRDVAIGLKNQGAILILGIREACDISSLGAVEVADEILFIFENKMDSEVLKGLYEVSNKIRFLFPYETNSRNFDERIRWIEGQGLSPRSSDYFEFWPMADMSQWYDPDYDVLFDFRGSEEEVHYSIIIPFQDNVNELKVMLKSLSLSLGANQCVEVLVLDDSFQLSQIPEVLKELQKLPIPSAYIKVKRPQARARGDFSFRAGVCRNIGATLSRGQELIFIDSDILIGPDFWETLMCLRGAHPGLIMPRRHFLLSDLPIGEKSYKDFNKGEDTQLSWGGHWEDFYRTSEDVVDIWRWTSTYCLVVPKSEFLAVGGFRRAFYCYGFEDTDLGYRLHQQGLTLKVLKADVFHMPVNEQRSEYAKDILQRKMLLRKSFEVFKRSALNSRLDELFRTVLT